MSTHINYSGGVAGQYSPSTHSDQRNNLIKHLSEAMRTKPLAIVITYDQAQAIIDQLAAGAVK